MHVFIVYAHPSEDSFTCAVRDQFIQGISSAGHTHELSDLYKMGFRTDMSEAEYLREADYRADLPVAPDVLIEQAKINRSDAIVFIYPVFWTEAPAKLVGWFDRVWTVGFAYGESRTMKTLSRALFLCIAGRSITHLTQHGHLQSMERVMAGDRMHERARRINFVVLDEMTKSDEAKRKSMWEPHLNLVREIASTF